MNGIIFVIYGFSSSTQCYHQLMESTTHRSKQIAVVIMWISRGLRIYKLNCWDIYYTYMCICLVVIHTNTIFFRGIPDGERIRGKRELYLNKEEKRKRDLIDDKLKDLWDSMHLYGLSCGSPSKAPCKVLQMQRKPRHGLLELLFHCS